MAVRQAYKTASSKSSGVNAFKVLPIFREFEPKQTTLDSGLNVVSQFAPGSYSNVSVFLGVGSRNETTKKHGVADLYRRAAFQTLHSEKFKSRFAELGGLITSRTEREKIVLSAQVEDKKVSKAIQLLAEVLQHPEITEHAIQHAKSQAYHDYDPTAPESLFEHLHESAFLDDSLGRSIIGSEESLANLHASDVESFKERVCTGGRIVVSVSGSSCHDDVLNASHEAFKNVQAGSNLLLSMRNALNRTDFYGSDKLIRFDSEPLAYFALAYETEKANHPEHVALGVVSQMLGSYHYLSGVGDKIGCRLSMAVAENHLAHEYRPFTFKYHDVGLFGIYAAAKPYKLRGLISAIMDNILFIVDSPTDYGVERGKMLFKQHILDTTSTKEQQSEKNARDIFDFGKVISVSEMFHKIDNLSKSDLQFALENVCHDRDHALAGYGNLHELPDYVAIRMRSYRIL